MNDKRTHTLERVNGAWKSTCGLSYHGDHRYSRGFGVDETDNINHSLPGSPFKHLGIVDCKSCIRIWKRRGRIISSRYRKEREKKCRQ